MAKTQNIVFYSWQSDLPNPTNRGFIEGALEKAVKTIQNDDTIEGGLIIDRDTKDVPGAPDIASTIFGKIEQAQVFLCDISIINKEAIEKVKAKPTPNPNVLIELGYAFKALGDKHIIMLLNDAYGEPNWLPFDLYTRRATTYHMPFENSDRASERNRLAGILTDALRIILNQLDKPLPGEPIQPLSLVEQIHGAIKADEPEQMRLVKQYMSELANKIEEMNPNYDSSDEKHCADQLREAIDNSVGMVVEFSRLAEYIILKDADQAIKAMYRGFESILNLCTFPLDYQGQRNVYVPDLARFLGHELFVTFINYFLQNDKWEHIAKLLDEELYARTTSGGQLSMVPFHFLSDLVRLLSGNYSNHLFIKPTSLHTNLLVERHTKDELGKLVPIEQFAETDYFLFLRVQIQPASVNGLPRWMPWSSLYIHQVPRYLQMAKYAKYAEQLLKPLRVEDILTLRTRLEERTGSLEKGWGYTPTRPWDNIIAGFDFSTIGTL